MTQTDDRKEEPGKRAGTGAEESARTWAPQWGSIIAFLILTTGVYFYLDTKISNARRENASKVDQVRQETQTAIARLTTRIDELYRSDK